MLREWASDEERQRALDEYMAEGSVWIKLLTEVSAAMGPRDPEGVLRRAVGEAIDRHWTGRMIDLVTVGEDGVLHSWRISSSMLIGECLELELRTHDDEGKADLDRSLKQITPWPDEGRGPDIFGIQCAPELARPLRLLSGAREGAFCIASIGGEPGTGLVSLAMETGGFAMPVRTVDEADAYGAALCARFYELARAQPPVRD